MRATIACFVQISTVLLLLVHPSQNQPRIIGGFASKEAKWPFMAAVLYRNTLHCGASVWNKDYVVTAAHCWKEPGQRKLKDVSLLSIYLGHIDVRKRNPEYLFQVKRVVLHPKYNTDSLNSDIALIQLARSIDFTGKHRRVSCVCDPEPREFLLTDRCIILGWGLTRAGDFGSKSRKLQETVVPLLNSSQCAAWDTGGKFNRHWFVCAGWPQGGKDTCNADSGGPLLCPLRTNPKTYSLVGITSYGSTICGDKKSPGYYTRVERFLHWIAEETK